MTARAECLARSGRYKEALEAAVLTLLHFLAPNAFPVAFLKVEVKIGEDWEEDEQDHLTLTLLPLGSKFP